MPVVTPHTWFPKLHPDNAGNSTRRSPQQCRDTLAISEATQCLTRSRVIHDPRARLAISLGCYRIQEPLKSNTKINTKKLQNHPFPVWPWKYEKITEKLQKWSFSGQFCNFSYFFRISGAKPEMGDFVFFLYFFVFPDLRGFL